MNFNLKNIRLRGTSKHYVIKFSIELNKIKSEIDRKVFIIHVTGFQSKPIF